MELDSDYCAAGSNCLPAGELLSLTAPNIKLTEQLDIHIYRLVNLHSGILNLRNEDFLRLFLRLDVATKQRLLGNLNFALGITNQGEV